VPGLQEEYPHNRMIGFLKPSPALERVAAERVDPLYRRLRRQVFLGIFLGYAAYYLVRNNLALAIPDILKEHPEYSKAMLGSALTGLSVAWSDHDHRLARAGPGPEEGRRHRGGIHRFFRLRVWLGCRRHGRGLDRGPLELERCVFDHGRLLCADDAF
jgi:hypothetical protein